MRLKLLHAPDDGGKAELPGTRSAQLPSIAMYPRLTAARAKWAARADMTANAEAA